MKATGSKVTFYQEKCLCEKKWGWVVVVHHRKLFQMGSNRKMKVAYYYMEDSLSVLTSSEELWGGKGMSELKILSGFIVFQQCKNSLTMKISLI